MVEDQQDHPESHFHQLDMFQEDELQLVVEVEEIPHLLMALKIEVIEEDQEVMEVVMVMEMVMVVEVAVVMEMAMAMVMDMAMVVVVVMAMAMEMKLGTETMKVAYPVIEDCLDCKDHKDHKDLWVCRESKEYKDC